MFEEELIIAIIITIFVLCLHYYFGVIDLWYMPAIEVLTCIIFYELSKAMDKSYETVDNHSRIQQEARENEVNIITEINTIKNAIQRIDNDDREKILITHYQFISTILNKNLNILNRWYLWDNNTHPTENHKYFELRF